MEINESSCLHVRDVDFHTVILIGPPPHMSIFSLVKGGKRTRSVRNVNVWEGRLNSYITKMAALIGGPLLF